MNDISTWSPPELNPDTKPAYTPPSTSDLIKKFIQMTIDKRTADAALDTRKQDLAILEKQLIERMTDEEIQNMKALGYVAGLHRILRPYVKGTDDELAAGLRDAGMGDIVKETVNRNSLGTRLREYLAEQSEGGIDDSALPEPLASAVEMTPVISLRVQKSK